MVLMMPRYSNRLRPVNSVKQVVDIQGGLLIGTQVAQILAVARDSPSAGVASEVEKGSTINGIFLNVQVAATSAAALANVYMAVVKNPGANLIFPNANAFGTSDQRRYAIHQEMIMVEKNSTGIARTLFKGVIKIPRGYKRMGIDDQIILLLFSPGVTMDVCTQCIYKSYK